MRVDVVAAIMAETPDRKLLRDVVAAVPPLAKHGGDRSEQDSDITSSIGRGAAYLIARLKAPRIA